MSDLSISKNQGPDRVHVVIAALVFLVSFVVYAMTVQRTFSFWDCGEFIACAYILGIPHPPGTPLFVLLGRVISLIPFVEDISYRINYISVISSALTAMLSYLLATKLIRYFFRRDEQSGILSRLVVYVGGITAGFFVAFSMTNWSNSVEAEVYGLSMALSVAILWLTIRYHEMKETPRGVQFLLLAWFLAVLGIGIHMTVFLVVPVCAVFFILKKSATRRDYLMVCCFAIIELLLVIMFSNGRGGSGVFMLVSAALGVVLVVMLYRKINWGILIAIGTTSMVMIEFGVYFKALPFGIAALLVLAWLSQRYGWQLKWRTALVMIMIGVVGLSVHLFIPIRSSLNPRIDENNPSRDLRTFVRFLDRKQYGQQSMIDRMFERRGAWSNQFGRHPNMGFWSYFEEQYSSGGWGFVPFLLLGLIGLAVAVRHRLEIGLPFVVLILLCSVGLVLYMNFADGTKYSPYTQDAYLEVRNRDYFFTPAFVFFGIAMGMGVAAVMRFIKDRTAQFAPSMQKTVVYASCVLVLLPGLALSRNYYPNDRSDNYLPYYYAKNLLDSCDQNAILFTAGDNDTFPTWCLQEVYDYRKDVRVVNLSLLNTDWYILQMKERYNVPISLSEEQILWYPYDLGNGIETSRPNKPFYDRPRGRQTYLHPQFSGMRTQDIMVDEIVLENKWRDPIFFSSSPWSDSPLKLRDHSVHVGQVYRLDAKPERMTDVDKGYDLFVNVYQFPGLQTPKVYRDENATGVFMGVALNSIRVYEELLRDGDTTRAETVLKSIIDKFPVYWQPYVSLEDLYNGRGDSAQAKALIEQAYNVLSAHAKANPSNYYYVSDLGMMETELGRINGDTEMIADGVDLLWKAFDMNSNVNLTFRKLVSVLRQQGRFTDLQRAARQFARYKINLGDPVLQAILGHTASGAGSPMPGY